MKYLFISFLVLASFTPNAFAAEAAAKPPTQCERAKEAEKYACDRVTDFESLMACLGSKFAVELAC